MIVADVMTTPASVVAPACHVKRALEILDARGITALPVVDEGRLIGIVSERDLIRGVLPRDLTHHVGVLPPESAPGPTVSVADVMRTRPITVGPDTDVAAAVDLMERHAVKSLPVVDTRGRVCGMVSRRDIVRVLATPDAEIAVQLRTQLAAKIDWRIQVVDGVAHMRGPRSASERALARATGYATPGVVEVVIDRPTEFVQRAD